MSTLIFIMYILNVVLLYLQIMSGGGWAFLMTRVNSSTPQSYIFSKNFTDRPRCARVLIKDESSMQRFMCKGFISRLRFLSS